MESVLTPYDILDISPRASTAEIKGRYRSLVLLYHPDKQTTNSVVMNFMSEDYFSKIQEAYKEIMKTRRIDDCPDDMIDYDVDDSFQQEIDHELRDILDMGSINDRLFNVEIQKQDQETFNELFNERFNEVNSAFNDLRINETKGHSTFNHLMTDPNQIVETYKPPEYKPMFEVERVQYKEPTVDVSNLTKSITGYTGNIQPFGRSSACNNFAMMDSSDFSAVSGGKNSLDLGDLGAVYHTQPIKESADPKKSTEELLKEKEEERSYDYVIATKEEAEKELEERKAKDELIYQRNKVEQESMWAKAVSASKKLLGY